MNSHRFYFFALFDLGFSDCIYRAGVDTSSTVGAGTGVDGVNRVAFSDSVDWARIYTCTTSDALVRNYVSHFSLLFRVD
jgi:hypothetical protein